MIYLGIDYGEKHVGVALAQGPLAEPLQSILRNQAIQLIKPLVKQYDIGAIVVGDCPESFLNELSGLEIVIHQADETLSSHDARKSLLHTSQKKRRLNEHAVSAAIILQTWLDQNQ